MTTSLAFALINLSSQGSKYSVTSINDVVSAPPNCKHLNPMKLSLSRREFSTKSKNLKYELEQIIFDSDHS